MATKVTVSKSKSSATVVLSTVPAGIPLDIKSNLSPASEAFVLDRSGKPHANRKYTAWEAACHSGIFSGYRRLQPAKGVAAVIEGISGRLNEDEATGFAVAARVAFECELRGSEHLDKEPSEGWVIEAVEPVPPAHQIS